MNSQSKLSRLPKFIGMMLVLAGIAYAAVSWYSRPLAKMVYEAMPKTQEVAAIQLPKTVEVHPVVKGRTPASVEPAEPPPPDIVAASGSPGPTFLDYLDKIVSAIVSLSGAYVLVLNAHRERKLASAKVEQPTT